jgi:acylphosphatase
MSEIVTKRCLVSGKVQGVFYRASARDKARSLGVSGWAKNLPDGQVEVVVSGSGDAVAALCDWLWEGRRLLASRRWTARITMT